MSDLNILVVCTGNICRSPMAEQLLRANFADADLDVEISSAGTGAADGQPMETVAATLSRTLGGEPHRFLSRVLRADAVAGADLILTATRAHRADVARLLPRAAPHTFTLEELARIIREIPAMAQQKAFVNVEGSAREIVARLTAVRGLAAPAAHAADDDIDDPYRQALEVHDRVALSIDTAVKTIVSIFRTSPVGAHVAA